MTKQKEPDCPDHEILWKTISYLDFILNLIYP